MKIVASDTGLAYPAFQMADDDDAASNRRTSTRFAARIRVRFRSVEDLVATYSADVSRGGMYVTASRQLPLGTEVELSVELPDDQPPAMIPARVTYVLDEEAARARGKTPGMGMQFLDADTTELARRIAEYLAAALDASAAPQEEPLRVLVIDDSASYRNEIASALREAGHHVTIAENGLAGLGKAIKELPDLVLSDVNMPVMDGWQFLRLVRARAATQRIPIAFLTTLGSEQDRLRGYEAGVDDYIPKPFTRHELLARVRRIVVRAVARASEGASTPSMSGDLRQVSLPSLLAFLEAERRSGLLVARGVIGETRVGVANGMVVQVDLPGAGAPATLFERLLRVLDILDGRFELRSGEQVAGSEVASIQLALLEHARRADEREG